MLLSALLLNLVSLGLCLNTGDIKVSFKAVKSSVESIDDIALSAIVSNPTNKDIRLFAKNNVLDPSSTRSFDVSRNGKEVQFTGIKAYFDLSSDALYTTIPANSSVAVNHTGLAPLYDFEQHGAGEFTFSPYAVFQIDPNSDAIEVAVNAVKVNVTTDVKRRELFSLAPRGSTPTCPYPERLKDLKESFVSAKTLAKQVQAYIKANPSGDLFKAFFKSNDPHEINVRFGRIATDYGNRKIHCTGDPAKKCGANSGVVAYTNLVLSNGHVVASDIYLCHSFWGFQTTKQTCKLSGVINNSKGGILLHEMSHATAATTDIVYGCSAVKSLSQSNQKRNADNYQCMALAVHRRYHC